MYGGHVKFCPCKGGRVKQQQLPAHLGLVQAVERTGIYQLFLCYAGIFVELVIGAQVVLAEY
jgi:hypothetical protein